MRCPDDGGTEWNQWRPRSRAAYLAGATRALEGGRAVRPTGSGCRGEIVRTDATKGHRHRGSTRVGIAATKAQVMLVPEVALPPGWTVTWRPSSQALPTSIGWLAVTSSARRQPACADGCQVAPTDPASDGRVRTGTLSVWDGVSGERWRRGMGTAPSCSNQETGNSAEGHRQH